MALTQRGIRYQEQVYSKLEYNDIKVGCYYFDFLIEGLIVLEIKQKPYLSRVDYEQIKSYLKHSGCPLGILATFGNEGVDFKRVLNLY